MRKVLHLLQKIGDFFRYRKILLVMLITNITFVLIGVLTPLARELGFWKLIGAFFILDVLIALMYYKEDVKEWLWKNPVAEKNIFNCVNVLGAIVPVIIYLNSIQLAKLVFEENLQKYETILILATIILQVLLLLYYGRELIDVNIENNDGLFKVQQFLFIIIHMIQLFTNIYILLVVLDHGAFENLEIVSASQVCFDLTYFSAMTFVTADGGLTPATQLAKLVVMIESFILAIYISIIIFGIMANNKKED